MWSYYILDKGRIIKNYKLKVIFDVKQLKVRHRLLLNETSTQVGECHLYLLKMYNKDRLVFSGLFARFRVVDRTWSYLNTTHQKL